MNDQPPPLYPPNAGLPVYPMRPTNSGLAIASLVCGILALACTGGLTAIPAVICGHMALSAIKRAPAGLEGKGMAIAGLVMGYVGILLMIVVAIYCVFMFKNMGKFTALAQNQINASQIHSACLSYAESHLGNLPPNLETLASEGLISGELLLGPPPEKSPDFFTLKHPGKKLDDLRPSDILFESKPYSIDILTMKIPDQIKVRVDGSVNSNNGGGNTRSRPRTRVEAEP